MRARRLCGLQVRAPHPLRLPDILSAAKYGRIQAVTTLLALGANPTISSNGMAPIHIACNEGKTGVQLVFSVALCGGVEFSVISYSIVS
jgi:hypothetical protein